MGVINVTPDSFYDGGQFLNEDRLMATINDYNEMGVQILVIGANHCVILELIASIL